MGKSSRTKNRPSTPSGEEGAVGPRQPCPCGSGKRYKACHGGAGGGAGVFVARPFEGLAGECDLIALRELVPAATAPLQVSGADGRVVKLCTLLPMAAPAMSRESGEVWLGLQVQHQYGDPSRDLAAVLQLALDSEPDLVGLPSDPGAGPRLQDLVTNTSLDVTVHDGFEFWTSDLEATNGLEDALAQANEAASPTARLTSVEAAYWTNVGPKEHLRWVMPEPEAELLDALARLHGDGADVIVPDARLVGMFRAHGLLVPVWDLPVGTGAEVLEEPAAAFKRALDDALADTSDLTTEQRSTRAGLANRQVTIR